MSDQPQQWRRKLKDGIEYHFSDGKGGGMSGSVAPGSHVDDLARIFEQATGCTLPEPEWKTPR